MSEIRVVRVDGLMEYEDVSAPATEGDKFIITMSDNWVFNNEGKQRTFLLALDNAMLTMFERWQVEFVKVDGLETLYAEAVEFTEGGIEFELLVGIFRYQPPSWANIWRDYIDSGKHSENLSIVERIDLIKSIEVRAKQGGRGEGVADMSEFDRLINMVFAYKSLSDEDAFEEVSIRKAATAVVEVVTWWHMEGDESTEDCNHPSILPDSCPQIPKAWLKNGLIDENISDHQQSLIKKRCIDSLAKRVHRTSKI